MEAGQGTYETSHSGALASMSDHGARTSERTARQQFPGPRETPAWGLCQEVEDLRIVLTRCLCLQYKLEPTL